MDTIMIIRDSVATCVNETAAICQPCVKEAETNWQDVLIVVAICMVFAFIAISICNRYFKWKDDERTAIANAATIKRKNEEDDRNSKIGADLQARDQSNEDHMLKRKEQLEDKLLCYLENRIKDGEAIAEDDRFVEELQKMIDAIIINNNDKEA